MKKIRLKKLNNQGSTFVMAIIVITLVTMLAVAILAASTHNMAMKAVDRNSKETFYNAETVMDEVRAGIGIESMKQLGLAYEKVITSLVSQNAGDLGYVVDNDEANDRFKAYFIESMFEIITGKDFGAGNFVTYTDEALGGAIETYLGYFLVGYNNDKIAEILSVGSIEAYKDGSGRAYMIIIRDVALLYKENKNGETYFSNVTTDLEIQFPNMTVAFTATNRLKDFIKYVFIADKNIDVGGEVEDNGVTVDSTASIYAGNTINIISNEYGASKLYMSGLTQNINVVCGGNENEGDVVSGTIYVGGSNTHKAEFITTNTDIWCTNIKIEKKPQVIGTKEIGDTSVGAVVSLSNGSNAYVRDDLTIDGQDSNVSISGSYYGYSSDGAQNVHAYSSAIIVNGKRATLDIHADKLLLAGHSYIEIPGTGYQVTGEALSFRENQDLYLIPTEYLAINYGKPVSNPMTISEWTALKEAVEASAGAKNPVKICDMTGFFAMKEGYVNTSIQYIDQQKGSGATGLVYLYINFKDKDAAADYIFDIAMNRNDPPQYLRNMLKKYTESLFEEGTGNGKTAGSVVIQNDTKVHSNGTVLNTDSASIIAGKDEIIDGNFVGASTSIPLGTDEFAITSMDLSNRYEILTRLLVDIPWKVMDISGESKYIVNSIESAVWMARDYMLGNNDLSLENIFDLIVDRSIIDAAINGDGKPGYNPAGETFNVIDDDGNAKTYIKIITKGDYTIKDVEGGLNGIVVATGTVYVEGNFKGIIIAGEDIKVKDNVTVSNDPDVVEKLITETNVYESYTEENKPTVSFREFFYAYKHAATDDDSREEVKIEKVDYKDIVKLNNWRKYYDKEESVTAEE